MAVMVNGAVVCCSVLGRREGEEGRGGKERRGRTRVVVMFGKLGRERGAFLHK